MSQLPLQLPIFLGGLTPHSGCWCIRLWTFSLCDSFKAKADTVFILRWRQSEGSSPFKKREEEEEEEGMAG